MYHMAPAKPHCNTYSLGRKHGLSFCCTRGIWENQLPCISHTGIHINIDGLNTSWGFPGGSGGKESTCSTGDLCSIPGWGKCPGEGNGTSLQYSCLGNPMDREAWWTTVHGIPRVGHDLKTQPSPQYIN